MSKYLGIERSYFMCSLVIIMGGLMVINFGIINYFWETLGIIGLTLGIVLFIFSPLGKIFVKEIKN